jgi:hypothetical protein
VVFSTNDAGITAHLYASPQKNLEPYFTPHTNSNSKWITYFCIRAETVKPEENIGENVSGLGLSTVLRHCIKNTIKKWEKWYIRLFQNSKLL